VRTLRQRRSVRTAHPVPFPAPSPRRRSHPGAGGHDAVCWACHDPLHPGRGARCQGGWKRRGAHRGGVVLRV